MFPPYFTRNASHTAHLAYLDTIWPFLNKAKEIYFAGKIGLSRLPSLDRFIAGLIKAVETQRRNWDKIRNWVPAIFA